MAKPGIFINLFPAQLYNDLQYLRYACVGDCITELDCHAEIISSLIAQSPNPAI